MKKIAVKQREQKRKRVDSSSSSNNSSSGSSVCIIGSESTISSGSSSVKNRVFCHRPHFQIGRCVCVACRFMLKPTWNHLEYLENPWNFTKNLRNLESPVTGSRYYHVQTFFLHCSLTFRYFLFIFHTFIQPILATQGLCSSIASPTLRNRQRTPTGHYITQTFLPCVRNDPRSSD